MRLTEIYKIADRLAPFSLSDEYCKLTGFHDNSGIQLDCGGEIEKILFALDLSSAAIERAKQRDADCIFTHHPAIFNPLYSISATGDGSEIFACVRAGISVISAHLNLDCAKGGIDDSLMQGLGGSEAVTLTPLSEGGYGKAFCVPETPFSDFVEKVHDTFNTKRIVAYGNRNVKKVASFCGAGMDGDTVAFALREGADTFVSSDGKHHLVSALAEQGLNVVLLTHYSAEFYGFARFYEKFQNQLKGTGVQTELFADERFL